MNHLRIVILICGIIVISAFSCKKAYKYIPPSDPNKAILGRWEGIEQGNWPNMEKSPPSGYIEYLPDSLMGVYSYKTKDYKIAKEKYWIDSLLHHMTIREDGYKLIFTYKYQFYEDKLRLDVNAWMIYNTTIYKRLK